MGIILAEILFAFSLFMIFRIYIEGQQEAEAFERLAQYAVGSKGKGISVSEIMAYNTSEEQGTETAAADVSDPEKAAEEIKAEDEIDYSLYSDIYAANKHCVRCLTVNHTRIKYPVIYSAEAPDYYLRRAFDGRASKSGTPFIGEGGSIDSDYFVIYGHNMKNSTMFGTLNYYARESFYSNNKVFSLLTREGERKYEIFGVLRSRIPYDDEDVFRYYQYTGELSEEDFSALTGWIKTYELYDTGITPVYGEKILILSTCSYHTKNGIFIVAAREI